MARTTVNNLAQLVERFNDINKDRGISTQLQMGNSTHKIASTLTLFGLNKSGERVHTSFKLGKSKAQAEEMLNALISYQEFVNRKAQK